MTEQVAFASSAPAGGGGGAAPASCSQAEFARVIKRSKAYVTSLKQAGRLVFDAQGLVLVQASIDLIRKTSGALERSSSVVQGRSYSDSQERERFYIAELKRLELERETRRLRPVEEVEAAVADAGALIRSSIESWRDRLPAQLAALGADEHRIAAFVADECERLLRRMSDRFAQMTAAFQGPVS